MVRENGKKNFRVVVLITIGFIFGLGVSVLAWVNPSQNPPLGGGVLQTDTSGLKIVTTTQITTGNFTVNNGNVGIASTTPSARLSIVGTGATDASIVKIDGGSARDAKLSFRAVGSDSVVANGSVETVGVGGHGGSATEIEGLHLRAYKNDDDSQLAPIVFNGNKFSFVNGNVGIGTTTTSQKLTVVGNIGIQAGVNAFIGTLDNYALSLRTNNTDRVFIDSSGNVGIGTTTPGYKLTVNSSNATDNLFQVATTTNQGIMVINNNGSVGIGTTTPTAKLNVVGGTFDIVNPGPDPSGIRTGADADFGRVWIEYSSALAIPKLIMADYDDPPRIAFRQTGTGNEVSPQYESWIGMSQGLSNNLAIMGGNVGIGTITPNSKLQVTGGDIYVSTQGNGIILRDTDGTGCHRITVNSAGTTTATAVACP